MQLRKTFRLFWLLLCCAGGCDRHAADRTTDVDPAQRPNILLIVADDLGYADLGIYGSDIKTPNIDALASQGVLFTQFHTAPTCALTRAMLLSGNHNNVAGMGRQTPGGLRGSTIPGYEGSLSERIAPFPALLLESGYHTYTIGKWHLGMTRETSPRAAGFSQAFNLLEGGGSHFNSVGFNEGGSTYREDENIVEYPDGRYSTEFYTDRLIEFIDSNKDDGKPFFAYAAYTSPHWPLQVPDEYLHLYKGHYDDGYDVLRERRFEALKKAGIIPLSSKLPPRNDSIARWEDLTAEQQRIESRKMELYAAMVDNLDDHVGRLLDYLQANGMYENTMVVFMSDNGPDGGDFYDRGPYRQYLRAHYDNAYEKMGTAASFVAYDKPWAEAGSAPFHRYKGFTRQGGIVSPMIIAGPGVAVSNAIDTAYVTVMDLAPTFLEIAGVKYPEDGSVYPMLGESAAGLLAGETDTIHDNRYVTTLYTGGKAYLRQGDWKIATLDAPFDEADFELFNLANDPGETVDLANGEAEKLAELIALWRTERKKLGIILPEDL